jgi:hypothetical protein
MTSRSYETTKRVGWVSGGGGSHAERRELSIGRYRVWPRRPTAADPATLKIREVNITTCDDRHD